MERPLTQAFVARKRQAGGAGAKGDYLYRLIVSVVTPATASVTILDGATSIVVLTGNVSLSPGVLSIQMDMVSSSGAWSVTTGAGCTVIGIGIFSA